MAKLAKKRPPKRNRMVLSLAASMGSTAKLLIIQRGASIDMAARPVSRSTAIPKRICKVNSIESFLSCGWI